MNRITIIWIASITLLLSFTNDEDEVRIITKEGVGDAKVNESSYHQVKNAYPGGKTTKEIWGGKKVTGSARLTNGECIPITMKPPKQVARTYTIEKEGISFYFNFLDTLSSITIWGKNKYKTDRGIIIGASTFDDLDSLYGKSSFGRIHSRLVKTYENLIFYANDSIVLEDEFTVKKEFDMLIIEEMKIVIY